MDPDNRRPVDYELRKQLLARVKAAVTTPDFPSFVVTALEDNGIFSFTLLFVYYFYYNIIFFDAFELIVD